MEISIVTQEDLQELKDTILSSIASLKDELSTQNTSSNDPVLLKSHQVQRMLGISPGTLQNMRAKGIIPYSKVGGVIFYNKEDLLNIIIDNKQYG